MAAMDVKEITLIGGEAYLRPDFITIVEEIHRHGIQVSTTTGGRGFTRELCERSKAAGLGGASVSIDGLERTHDRLRGVAGSFRSVLAAMQNLRAAGIRVYNNTQINRLNMPELPDILEVMIEHGSTAWQIMLTVPMGRAVDEPEVMLQPYDLLELFPLLARIKERADQGGVSIFRGNNLGYFGPFETLFKGWTPTGHHSSCGAGRSTLGIEADGTIKGCPSLGTETWGAGNIRDHRLEQIWELSDMLLGRPGNNPYCHHRALELERQGKRERVERVEEAPGKPFDQGRFEIVLEDSPRD
jgi:MoaA/NifB/PqqE/SkfB family radical SAM enzyme